MTPSPFDLQVRTKIYGYFAKKCAAPTYQEIAALLGVDEASTQASFHSLHAHHMLFLQPGSDLLRMANPFSAVPTRYKVFIGTRQWFANCAWDALGIAAALHSDAIIQAGYPDENIAVELRVENGVVDGKGNGVYFALPCRQWYNDLVFT